MKLANIVETEKVHELLSNHGKNHQISLTAASSLYTGIPPDEFVKWVKMEVKERQSCKLIEQKEHPNECFIALNSISQLVAQWNAKVNQKIKIFKVLENARYFNDASKEVLETLIIFAEPKNVDEGEVILHQDIINGTLYCLVKGCVKIQVNKKTIYKLHRKGDMFGEMSVITQQPSDYAAIGGNDVLVISLSTTSLKQIKDKSGRLHHQLDKLFNTILINKLKQTSRKASLHEELLQKQRYELHAAYQLLDETFFRKCVSIPNFPHSITYQPADIMGGDFYGIYEIKKNKYGILIGSITGYGTPSALLNSILLNLFQQTVKGIESPLTLINHVNNLCEPMMPKGYYATVFYGVYNSENKKIAYVNAGSHAALIQRENRVMGIIPTEGLPLGWRSSDTAGFTEETYVFQPGDRLFLFTNGILRSEEQESTSTAMKYVAQIIGENKTLQTKELAEKLVSYNQSIKRKDDFTLLIFDDDG